MLFRSPEGDRLYYSALSGRRLYSVATEALLEPESDASGSVKDEGDKGGEAARAMLTLVQLKRAVAKR